MYLAQIALIGPLYYIKLAILLLAMTRTLDFLRPFADCVELDSNGRMNCLFFEQAAVISVQEAAFVFRFCSYFS